MGHPAEKLHRPPATYADYAAVPDHLHAEIIRGTLHVMPRPAPRHALSSSRLGGRLYAQHGVPFAWLVDPIARTLEAYSLQQDGTWSEPLVLQRADRGRIRPFEAIEIALSVLWPD